MRPRRNLAEQRRELFAQENPLALVEPPECCDRSGAIRLKLKIEAYWRERGQKVEISLHNVGFHPAIRSARYDTRSNMKNGLPAQPVHEEDVANEP